MGLIDGGCFGMKSRNFSHRLGLAVLTMVAWTAIGQTARAGAEGSPGEALARLDARLAAQPDDLEARAERARMRAARGLPMGAYLDRLEIVRRHPGDAGAARLAAFALADAGAPQAAAD